MSIDLQEVKQQAMSLIATQYRESPNLIAFIECFIDELLEPAQVLCDIQESIDLDTASGVLLETFGNDIGFARSHCDAKLKQYFGYDGGLNLGYDDGVYFEEGNPQYETYTIDDDDRYRELIKVRLIANVARGTPEDIISASRLIWGDDIRLVNTSGGVTDILICRPLTLEEQLLNRFYVSLLPCAMGSRVRIMQGTYT